MDGEADDEAQRAIATKGLIRDLLCFYEPVEHRSQPIYDESNMSFYQIRISDVQNN